LHQQHIFYSRHLDALAGAKSAVTGNGNFVRGHFGDLQLPGTVTARNLEEI